MLSKRLTAPFRIVSISDESVIRALDDLEMHDYVRTRDFSAIEEKLKKAEYPPTIFHCKPLLVEYEHIADQASMTTLQSDAAWKVFRHHVERIENFEDRISFDDNGTIKNEHRKDIDRDVVDEISYVICQKANSKTRGFTPPRTFSADLIQARLALRRADDAKANSASEKKTDTSPE